MLSCKVGASRTGEYWTQGRTKTFISTVREPSAVCPQIKLPKSFSMNIKLAEAIHLYERESTRPGASGSGFLNELLLLLSQFPKVFSAQNDSILYELAAGYTLLNDRLMLQVSQMAKRSRRDPVQMLLLLIERGLESVDPPGVTTYPIADTNQGNSLLRFDYKELLTPSAVLTEDPLKTYANLKTVEVVDFLASEGNKQSNKTVFVNQLFLLLSKMPRVLSPSRKPLLVELEEYKKMLSESLVSLIPELAVRSRRDPLQMFLFLLEQGLERQLND